MNGTLNIDKAGRLILPKPVRDEMQLAPGDALEFDATADCIVLRPARPKRRLFKKQGIWVLHTGAPMSADLFTEVISQLRRERDERASRR